MKIINFVSTLICTSLLVIGCGSGSKGNEEGNPTNNKPDCSSISNVTDKIYFSFVIHNEEDDADGVANSNPLIPDYNGDESVFNHYADAMMAYGVMLHSFGATLSFQPDWTFIEGVQKFRPDFFKDLLALGTVEIIPHAHESYVSYDKVYERLEQAGAQPYKIIGGMTYDTYLTKQEWFEANTGWAFWKAPTQSPGHIGDKPAPPFVYRISEPGDVSDYTDLYRHVSDSPIIVSPGLESDMKEMMQNKPTGHYITPAYDFKATRHFLADNKDLDIPAQWRKPTNLSDDQMKDSMTSDEIIKATAIKIEKELLPLVNEGKVEFKKVNEIIDLYRNNEPCLDLIDNQDLCEFTDCPASST